MKSAPLSRRWTMTRRTASKAIPAHWKRKPTMTNWISPMEAITTPMTMKDTLPSVFRLTGDTPRPQVVMRTATGIVALSIWMKATLRYRYAWLPQIKLILKKIPMGTIARR